MLKSSNRKKTEYISFSTDKFLENFTFIVSFLGNGVQDDELELSIEEQGVEYRRGSPNPHHVGLMVYHNMIKFKYCRSTYSYRQRNCTLINDVISVCLT